MAPRPFARQYRTDDVDIPMQSNGNRRRWLLVFQADGRDEQAHEQGSTNAGPDHRAGLKRLDGCIRCIPEPDHVDHAEAAGVSAQCIQGRTPGSRSKTRDRNRRRVPDRLAAAKARTPISPPCAGACRSVPQLPQAQASVRAAGSRLVSALRACAHAPMPSVYFET